MSKLTINTGTTANSGNGDTLFSAFTKVNSNFTELYTQIGGTESAARKDIQGSVFADDSTLLIDSISGKIVGVVESTSVTATNLVGSLAGNVTGNVTSSGTSTFSGTLDLTGATVSSDVNFGDNDLTDINNLTIGGSLLTETMSPLIASAGNGQNLTLAGGQSTAGDGGDAVINAGSGTGTNGDVQIGASNTATVTIGDGSNTVDYPSGTTVDFTGATVTGLAGHTETDPIVGAITGIVKADGAGNISAAVAGTDYLTTVAFADVTGKPTTISGYGITDALATPGDNIALGTSSSAGTEGVGIGKGTSAGDYAQAIGNNAGNTGQGVAAVALGSQSGETNQGDKAIAIGQYAGQTNQAANSIVLNATGAALENTTADSLVIKPVRNASGTHSMEYNPTTGEVTYDTLGGGAFADLTGKPTTLAGYGITDAASTSAETTFTADVKFDTGVEEKFFLITGSASVIAMDCDNGHIHYLTGLANDITANFANLDLTVSYATNVTVIIDQGATPYEITAVEIGGAAQTIEWQGNSAPTGTANGIDSFSFTIFNRSGTYVVLGQMVAFGGV